ncbi:MAG: NADH-quinone oxidoreductase subunit M [Chloroflexota bacterium]
MLEFALENLLTLLLVLPAVSGLILLLLPENDYLQRGMALTFSTLIGLLTIFIFYSYPAAQGANGYAFEINNEWFSPIGANWHLGIDGISASMILLTGILVPLSVLVSFEVHEGVKMHMALLLFFQVGLFGVFVALDLMIFFLFYELSLVPIYFLIKQWGGKNRLYASTKFFIYSMGGTLGMLLATQLIGWSMSLTPVGEPSFDIVAISQNWPMLRADEMFLGQPVGVIKALAFVGFFIAFCIKVPVWPFHTWLPDAHSEAPTAGSMLLAGVMLKLGAYGFLRLVIPFFPDVWIREFMFLGAIPTDAATIFATLAMLGVVLGAFAAFGQNDIKRLVAYSSVNHMGFVAMGLAVTALAYGRLYMEGTLDEAMMGHAIIATNGAVLQMFNHGLSSAGMFLLAGAIYHKTHTRDMTQYGGLWVKAPVYGGIFIFTSMASLGLPGLNGFVSEFLVVRGSFPVFTWLTVLAMIGLLFTGSYILKGIRAVLQGPFNMQWKDTKLELDRNELIAIAPLMVLMLITGLAPNWVLATINDSVTFMLTAIMG